MENKHISIAQTIKEYKETIHTTEEKVVVLERKLQEAENKYHETLVQKEKNEFHISSLEIEISKLNEKIRYV